MSTALLAALTWEPNIKGGLYVLIAVAILCGSAQLLLSTNMGPRLGFLLAAAGLFGFFVIIGSVWWVYAIGPKGPDPSWKPQGIVVGDLKHPPAEARAAAAALAGYPREWEKLELTDQEVADAMAVVDADLTTGAKRFSKATDYLAVGAYTKGGRDFGPLGLDFRPFDLFHTPHYLVIQVQPVLEQHAEPGQAAPRPKVDPSADPVAVVMLRDLGKRRLHPAVFTIASLLIFGLLVNQLHVRDKEAMAKRA